MRFWRTLAYFFSKSASQILDFFANRKYLQSSIDSENLKKIAIPRFKKNALKVGKNAFSTEYFRVVRRLNNGLMVTPPGGSLVTVRDTPPNVLGVK